MILFVVAYRLYDPRTEKKRDTFWKHMCIVLLAHALFYLKKKEKEKGVVVFQVQICLSVCNTMSPGYLRIAFGMPCCTACSWRETTKVRPAGSSTASRAA